MKRLIFLLLVCTLSSSLMSTARSAEDGCDRCSPKLSPQELEKVKLPDVTIDSAKHFYAGANRAKVDHVQVLGMIGGNIGFELLLPDQWNARFVMGGGGLFVGEIQNAARSSVNDGYATVGTDTGHRSPSRYLADWAYLDLEAQLNFGYLAVHRTAEVARAMVRLHYGCDARYSYFYGCSTGGRQGLMEAARYPNDFDGIVSACPVASKTGVYASFINYVQTFFPTPPRAGGPLFAEEELKDFHEQVLEQCDENDGLKDGIINNPLVCQLNWGQIVGFNPEQIQALKSVYEGPTVGNQSLYPGLLLGSELRWYRWFVGPDPSGIATHGPTSALGLACTQFGRYLVFDNPEWTPAGYDLANWRRDTRRASSILDCANPNLQPFHDSGGKLIIWHALSDAGLTAKATVGYYENINNAAKDEFVRLYLLPGVYHCGRGPGPSEINWLEVISNWVERNQTPRRLVVTKRDEDGHVVMTRPIFPYPTYVKYKGSGDPQDAWSFEPVEASREETREQPD